MTRREVTRPEVGAQSNASEANPRINVTPLIDVLLVVLIIFLVLTPLKPARFMAAVPSKPDRDDRVQANINTLVVTIKSDRTLMLNSLTDMRSAIYFSNDYRTTPLARRCAIESTCLTPCASRKQSSSKLHVQFLTAKSCASSTESEERAPVRLAFRSTI